MYVVVSFSHGLYYNFCAWGMGMFTSVYQIAIERNRYVTLRWQQNFWMTTNRKSHLKVYSHYFKLHRSYSISFNLANLGKIFPGTVSIVI